MLVLRASIKKLKEVGITHHPETQKSLKLCKTLELASLLAGTKLSLIKIENIFLTRVFSIFVFVYILQILELLKSNIKN